MYFYFLLCHFFLFFEGIYYCFIFVWCNFYFFFFFFFFKQQTAYERRISGWSSDVCSSDLFAGLGAGAAMGGLKPIIEFMTFNVAMQAIDHIINSAAKTNYMSGGQMRCPIVFRGPNGAAARVGAQHSQNFAPWYASVPGLIVIAPYDAADAKGLLKAAIRTEDPVVFLENELLYGRSFDVPDVDDFVLPIGKARIMRKGSDVTIVSYSIGVGLALEAADQLAGEGIDAEVIDLRTIRPLDTATVLASLKKTNHPVIVEEGWPVCSIASELAMVAMEHGFDDLSAPGLS